MYQNDMQDGSTPFTPAVTLLYALNEACDMILEEGLPARYERHRICAEAVYNGMEAMGLGLYAEKESRSHTVAAVNSPMGMDEGESEGTHKNEVWNRLRRKPRESERKNVQSWNHGQRRISRHNDNSWRHRIRNIGTGI